MRAMKHLVVSVAGLGWREWETGGTERLAGLAFRPAASVFPAVTCVAQGTLRTGLPPAAHGMTSNGFWSHALRRPSFWEQSSALVLGPRVWDAARAAGETVAFCFFQQSLGEDVDVLVSPAHVHFHGGGSALYRWTVPPEADESLRKARGTFPLWRYWGPLARPEVGDACVGDFLFLADRYDPDIAFLYLPTLDYDAQRYGPDDPRAVRARAVFRRELERLAAFAEQAGADLTVFGEYAIAPVSAPPAFPNRTLRRAGLLRVRTVRGRAYPDFHLSKAFAMADHEIAHVFVRDPDDIPFVRDVLAETGDYAEILARSDGGAWAHPSAGDLLLVAREGSWCAYPWWTDRREEPDYAAHVDIHAKPGFDPCELFFDRRVPIPPATARDPGRVRGTHGRVRPVAFASSAASPPSGETFEALAAGLPSLFAGTVPAPDPAPSTRTSPLP